MQVIVGVGNGICVCRICRNIIRAGQRSIYIKTDQHPERSFAPVMQVHSDPEDCHESRRCHPYILRRNASGTECPLQARRPGGWLNVSKSWAKNGQEPTYRISLRDVSVVNINARIQALLLRHGANGLEFHTRRAWDLFCYRIIKGEVSKVTLNSVKNSMDSWPKDLKRVWKFIFNLKKEFAKYKLQPDYVDMEGMHSVYTQL